MGRTSVLLSIGIFALLVKHDNVIGVAGAGSERTQNSHKVHPTPPILDLATGGIPKELGGPHVPNDLILDPVPPNFGPSLPNEKEMWQAVIKARFDRPRFLVERIGQKYEPCISFPLIGSFRRARSRYKCTIYFDERVHGRKEPGVEIIYIDKEFIERCPAIHEHGAFSVRPMH